MTRPNAEPLLASFGQGFTPIYETVGAGPPLTRSVLLSIMEAAASAAVERAEIKDRWYRGMACGDQLKVLFAIAQIEPKRASWHAATRLVEWQTRKRRAYLYQARRQFLPVIHLWAAFILRNQEFFADRTREYRAIDDLHMFVTEAMALLQWGVRFKLERKKAGPTLNRQAVDFWTPPPDWSPPLPRPEWPRDGRLPRVSLEENWMRRTRSKPPRKNLSNLP